MIRDQQLSEHFMLGEFLCPNTMHLPEACQGNLRRLALALEQVRTKLGNRPIIITSGYRTVEHNKAVGGAKNSFHLRGMAADIVVKGMEAHEVQAILKDWPGGMGFGETFTHLDIRPYRARFHYGV